MKTKNDIKGFFWHWLSFVAIKNGWDFEGDMLTYAAKEKDNLAFTGPEDTNVNISDVIELVQNNAFSEALHNFLVAVYNKLKENTDIEDSTTLMCSMHSGSSDYFTYEMLKDYVGA